MVEVSAVFVFVCGLIIGIMLGAMCVIIAALTYKDKKGENNGNNKEGKTDLRSKR